MDYRKQELKKLCEMIFGTDAGEEVAQKIYRAAEDCIDWIIDETDEWSEFDEDKFRLCSRYGIDRSINDLISSGIEPAHGDYEHLWEMIDHKIQDDLLEEIKENFKYVFTELYARRYVAEAEKKNATR